MGMSRPGLQIVLAPPSKKISRKIGLCIKVGRGQGDGDIGTRVWGLGTWDLGTRDEGLGEVKYGTRGRVGRERGDVKCREAGGCGM